MCQSPCPSPNATQQGVVLPIALIMLVIISFAGMIAARNSATFEQFSNNMRTNQVARVSAEDALRRCERIARDSVDGTGSSAAADIAKIFATEITADTDEAMELGLWNIRQSWANGQANLITIAPGYEDDVQQKARLKNAPTCIIQAMVNDRFLVTTRGLSNDAVVSGDGTLTQGSEVWLQSILTPTTPTQCGGAPC